MTWPLVGSVNRPEKVNTVVGADIEMNLFNESWVLETSNFRLFNINPSEDPGKKFKNVGPSVQFKMRDKTGEAKEYLNYMLPMERDGEFYFMSGVRGSPAEEFRYLYIPMDDAGGINRFMKYLSALSNVPLLEEIAAKQNFTGSAVPSKEAAQLNKAMVRLTGLFVSSGMESVIEQVEKNVPVEKRDEVKQPHVRVLQQLLGAVYADVLSQAGVDVSLGADAKQAAFFAAASAAIGAISRYGSPAYFQLTNFTHHQASGLQIAKAPGKNLVYPGCAMLILGVFLMFYAPQQRLWAWLQPTENGIKFVLAGHAVRNKMDFEKEYQNIKAQFDRVLTG